MDRAEFRAALQRAGLGTHVDALVAARPSIRLEADTEFDHDRLGASRLGGDPDLPPVRLGLRDHRCDGPVIARR